MTKYLIVSIFLSLFLSSCAVQGGQLEGGSKDTLAPKIDSSRSTPNFQTHFEKKTIRLAFNEWIVLDNAQTQVVVSPPLLEKPSIKLDGKTLVFDFAKNEVLRSNATYTINFAESIKDLTEGNKAKIRFVFSTGDVLDSLKVRTQVLNALTREPVENILFMLYDNFSDSVVRKERPFYFAKTDKQGFAVIENVRKGSFKGFALEDTDLNYKYNLPTEKIGFLKENITLPANKNDSSLIILLSEPRKKLQLLDKTSSTYGLVKLFFSQEAKSISPTWEDKAQTILRENDGDTLKIWYDNKNSDAWKIFVLKKDTINVKNLSRTDFLKKNKLAAAGVATGRGGKTAAIEQVSVPPTLAHTLTWNFPIVKIDTSKIHFKEDSTKKTLPLHTYIDSISVRKVNFKANWKEGKTYIFTLLPGALTDFFGNTNDTLSQKINIAKKKDFGDIIAEIDSLDTKNTYLVQLLSTSNIVQGEKTIKKSKKGRVVFSTLAPTKYKIRIITDLNKNGRWDGADYDNHLLPEPVYIKELDELKANWELETAILLPNF